MSNNIEKAGAITEFISNIMVSAHYLMAVRYMGYTDLPGIDDAGIEAVKTGTAMRIAIGDTTEENLKVFGNPYTDRLYKLVDTVVLSDEVPWDEVIQAFKEVQEQQLKMLTVFGQVMSSRDG